ncbi:hypothetical protein GPJ59_18940 [Streptomyces bambusae]|uniref:Outer membrane channel protein CpnT-like N-terminal domain-containing protein n=1 Tax=Streptomyces bambusae TaxID=1550616 RepID=A0ABS6Z8N2_9ACTN|nr:hypothetical protein [Streptomyces bambusae]
MAVTVPDWADTLLDLVGVNWPNVDEDAYREMADALREFADDLEDDGQLANNHFERLLSSGEGESIKALDEHWKTVKGKHLKDIVSAARTIAKALDLAAGAIEAMKGKAVVELGVLAGQTGLALSLIPVTGGLSALLGAGAIALTKKTLLKLLTEAAEEAVAHIVAAMTEPAVAALEGMAADLVVQLGAMAIGLQDGVDLDQTKQAGKDGFKDGVQSGKESLNLASAGGGSGGAGGGSGLSDLFIDHDEHDRAHGKLTGVSTNIHGKTTSKLTKAKTAHGRTRGRDSIAQAIDPVADKAVAALMKATKQVGDHMGKTLPKAVKQISTDHKNNDDDLAARIAKAKAKAQQGGKGGGGNGGGGGGGSKPPTGGGGGGNNNNGNNGNGPKGNPLNPQPDWHGKSSKGMKNHRRDAQDVKHLSEDEQKKLMVSEAKQLADNAQKQPVSNPYPEGKHRLKTACAGTLLHDGVLTTHSSNTSIGNSQMNTHPALKQILDKVEQDMVAANLSPGNGHGKCAEVSLISDRLHHLDPTGTKIVTADDVQKAMKGSLVYSVQIGNLRPGEGQLFHGDYKPPCRSCARMLPLAGVIAHH